MKTQTLLLFQAFFILSTSADAQWNPDHRLIPSDVQSACVPGAESFLVGKMEVLSGEAVVCNNRLGASATSEKDAELWMSPEMVKKSVFIYLGGDLLRSVRLSIVGTNEVVIMRQPIDLNNVSGSLVALAELKTIVGAPKSVVSNRLISPSTITTATDSGGGQIWHYYKDKTETKNETQFVTSTTTGSFDNIPFGSESSTKIIIGLSRKVVLWDFKLTFSKEGKVESFASGAPGYGPWTRTK
jgi:hypothetical protein